MEKKNFKISTLDIAYVGLMVAVIEVSKAALSFLPNIELTSFWLILFTLTFGWRILAIVPIFIVIEGMIYGIHLWWIMYLYVWPLLACLTRIFRRREEPLFWAILSGGFGLSFGYLCSLVYLVIGIGEGGLKNGLHTQLAWWIAGIPYDLVHCVGNFVLMLVLYRPVRKAIDKVMKTQVAP
ncbi:MAG: hypothetical protein IKR61_07320 [Lachnospiraceae bacterium]|nr:hypothetical protein [Lachnospiraceae bacterium]